MEFGGKNTYAGSLHENDKEQEFRERLRKKSPIFPKTYEEAYDESTYVSTWLRILYQEKYYLVLCIESARLSPSYNKLDLYKRVMLSMYQNMAIGYIPNDIMLREGLAVKLDPNQQSERDRVLTINFH